MSKRTPTKSKEQAQEVIEVALPKLREIYQSPLCLPGLLFLGLNLWYTYAFYHVNTYKLLFLSGSVTLLFVINDVWGLKKDQRKDQVLTNWKSIGWIALPLLGTIPGLLLHQGGVNYYLPIELSTYLMLILWVGYLLKRTQSFSDLSVLLFLISLTVLYCTGWAFLEKLEIITTRVNYKGAIRVIATQGNANYFSGFMVCLLPLFLLWSFPDYQKDPNRKWWKRFSFKIVHKYYAVIFILATIALYLALSRSAFGALVGSVVLGGALYLFVVIAPGVKKTLAITLGGIGILILGILGMDYGIGTGRLVEKFLELGSILEWGERFIPWRAAWASVQDSIWVGYGLGSSYDLFFEYVRPDTRLIQELRMYNHVHLELLENLQEGGLFGIITLVGFWGVVYWGLFKIIFDKLAPTAYKRFAIGILCGTLAIHSQGMFSLAPRMIVVKLPLYTLLAFSFILFRMHQVPKPKITNAPSLTLQHKIFMVTLPSLILLLVAWGVLGPWARDFYLYSKAHNKVRSSVALMQKLELVMANTPNIYGLRELANLQLRYNRPGVSKTIQQTQEMIPHYELSNYFETLNALKRQEVDKAFRLGKAAQRRDLYHSGTIALMAVLSAKQGKAFDFVRQLELMIEKILIKNKTKSIRDPDLIQVKVVEKMPKAFKMVFHEGKFKLSFRQDFVERIMNWVAKGGFRPNISGRDRQEFHKYLQTRIYQASYFKLRVKNHIDAKESQGIPFHLKTMNEYRIKLNQKLRQLHMKHQQQLSRTPQGAHRKLKKAYKQKQNELNAEYNKYVIPHLEYLRQTTKWDKHQKDLTLAKKIISTILNWPQIRI